jgi:hypothetical protein
VHPLFLSEAIEFVGSHNALHRSKALKHGHCRVRTSSIGADRGDNGIWIYELTGSFVIVNNVNQIASASTKQRWLLFIDIYCSRKLAHYTDRPHRHLLGVEKLQRPRILLRRKIRGR